MKIKAIFLDRDGTINIEKKYLYKISDFVFTDGCIEGLYKMQDMGYKLFIITNQSGIARGYYKEQDMQKLHKYIINKLKENNIKIEKIYYCPHLGETCECRKPKLGLFYQAKEEYNIDFSKSFAIGDNLRDIAICNVEKVRGILLKKGKKIKRENKYYCENLNEAAEYIKKEEIY